MTLAERKVLVISGAFPPGRSGEAHHALLLAQHLAKRGFDVDVLTTAGAVSDRTVQVWPLMREWSWREFPRLPAFLRSKRPDVVLLMYIGWIYNDHPMITHAPTIARLLLPRSRFVTQFENVIGSLPGLKGIPGQLCAVAAVGAAGIWKVHYRFGTLLRDSHRLIALSEPHRRLLSGRFRSSNRRIVLIPPPPLTKPSPDTDETRRRGRDLLGVDDEHFSILYLGYIYPGKGLETLLRAFAMLVAERPYNEARDRWRRARGKQSEAAFRDHHNFLFCPPHDPGDMAQAIKELIDDGCLRRRLARRSHALAQEWFSWDRAVDRTIATFG